MKTFTLIFLIFFGSEIKSSYVLDRIEFEHNSSEINISEATKIKNVAKALNDISGERHGDKFTLWIEGYANPFELNSERLAKSRAKAVRNELVQLKLPKLKIVVRSFGSERPLADPISEHKVKNQRVEFKLN